MKKFIATPGAEVIGSAMRNLFISIGGDEFQNIVTETLAQQGIHELHDDQWYPHQVSLDIFKLVLDQNINSTHNLVGLGMAYVETATFPPEINNVYSALTALSMVYHLNIRNIPQDEGYEVKQISEQEIQIIDRNPFPHDTVYGFIWGIAKRFRASKDVFPSIKRTYFNPDDPDADGAVYQILLNP